MEIDLPCERSALIEPSEAGRLKCGMHLLGWVNESPKLILDLDSSNSPCLQGFPCVHVHSDDGPRDSHDVRPSYCVR